MVSCMAVPGCMLLWLGKVCSRGHGSLRLLCMELCLQPADYRQEVVDLAIEEVEALLDLLV